MLETLGIFFYYTTVRQDLLAKLLVVSTVEIPSISKIEVVFRSPANAVSSVSDNMMFRWWLILEWLLGCSGSGQKLGVTRVDHFNYFHKVQFSSYLYKKPTEAFNFFVLFFFIWFRGMYTGTEIYSAVKGYLPRGKWKNCLYDDRLAMEYIVYKTPTQYVEKPISRITTVWFGSSFVSVIPIDIAAGVGPFRIIFYFESKDNKGNQALLSALRFQQRIIFSTDALLNT